MFSLGDDCGNDCVVQYVYEMRFLK